jgi:uncharacterized protein
MKSVHIFRLLFLFVALVLGGAVVRAEDMNAIKARMDQRIGAVDALRDRGAAGENNRGYLEARGGATGDDQKIIADENADRRAVYAAIGAQTGSDPETVGRARARQIAANSRRGVWIQGADGNWTQKG